MKLRDMIFGTEVNGLPICIGCTTDHTLSPINTDSDEYKQLSEFGCECGVSCGTVRGEPSNISGTPMCPGIHLHLSHSSAI